jgi:hypothetical protein
LGCATSGRPLTKDHEEGVVDNETLQAHMLSTYNSLRFGMFVIAAAAPIVIVLWGFLFHVDWLNSISAYYFAPTADKWVYSAYPTRVLFVGILFALGSFLYLYKGFSTRENVALNCAGACALGVALFPMYRETGYLPFSNILHFSFAILLFVCMAYTAIFCHEDTLRFVTDVNRRKHYKVVYHVIGLFMGLFPLVGLIMAVIFNAMQRHVFWIEAAGIWAFAAYWFIKSKELEESQAEVKAAAGRLTQPPPAQSSSQPPAVYDPKGEPIAQV